jgi:hypothetical protein
VTVQTGLCDVAAGTTPVDVAIDPAGSSTVTLTSEDGSFTTTFTDSGGSEAIGPGTYTWTAEPAEGATIAGETTGSVTATPCEERPDFALRELELLRHIPGEIRDSCQQVPPEETLARAAASLVCESGPTTLFYDLSPNPGDMQAYYDSRVRDFGVPGAQGFCDTAQEAENAYGRERGGQTIEIGWLLCLRDGRNAVLIWTDNRASISVEAFQVASNNEDLYRQWSRVAFGPLV